MNKKDILRAEREKFEKNIPLLECIYLVPTKEIHDSNYRVIDIIGCNNELNYLKKINYGSDVVIFNLMQKNKCSLSIDVESENDFIRIFSMYGKIKVNFKTSTFDFEIVEYK